MQYTIRGVSKEVDDLIRERAFKTGKSLNRTAVAVLAEGAGSQGQISKFRDLLELFVRENTEGAEGPQESPGAAAGRDLSNLHVVIDLDAYNRALMCMHRTIELLEFAAAVNLPFCVLAELRAAFRAGASPIEDERRLRQFLMKPGVKILFPDDQTTHHYAAICRQLDQQGTPMPANATWVAALALQHNLALHAFNGVFAHLPQLVRV